MSPSARVCHSCGLISRGTRSTEKRRFSPSTPNVIPARSTQSGAPGLRALSSGLAGAAVVLDEIPIHRPGPAARTERLVAGAEPVTAERGRVEGLLGASGRTVRLGDHQLDHVVEPAAFGVGGALPVGRVAARQRRLGQLADLGPVAELLQLRPEPLEQCPDRLLSGQRLGVAGVVQQRAGQPAARGLPDRCPVHRRRHRIEGPAAGDVAFGGQDRRRGTGPAIRIASSTIGHASQVRSSRVGAWADGRTSK